MINDCKVQKHCKRIILMIISRMHHKLYKNHNTIFHNPHLFSLFCLLYIMTLFIKSDEDYSRSVFDYLLNS